MTIYIININHNLYYVLYLLSLLHILCTQTHSLYTTGPTLLDLSITRGIASFLSQYNCVQHLIRGHGDFWTRTTLSLLKRVATFDTFYHKMRYACMQAFSDVVEAHATAADFL